MRTLTERQKEIVNHIDEYIKQNGFSPSIRDIALHFEISAKGAHDHILALEKKGAIKRHFKKSRSLTILRGSGRN